jgi:hypothetical protein
VKASVPLTVSTVAPPHSSTAALPATLPSARGAVDHQVSLTETATGRRVAC